MDEVAVEPTADEPETSAAKRPDRRLLAVLAVSLVLAGAGLTSALVSRQLDEQQAKRELGPVDEIVLLEGASDVLEAEEIISLLDSELIDGALGMTSTSGVASYEAEGDSRSVDVQILQIDFFQAGQFGGNQAETGIDGPTPTGNTAVINESLASALGVGDGDALTVKLFDTSLLLTVGRVLDDRGVAGLRLNENEGRNLFLPPGTLQALSLEGASPEGRVLVSNAGGAIAGAGRTEAVVSALDSGLPGAEIAAVKSEIMEGHDSTERIGWIVAIVAAFSGLISMLVMLLRHM